MKDKVIVITGASGGIGATLAETVSKRGAKPVLFARREKELNEVAARCGGAQVVVGDITKRADQQRLADEAVRKHGHIDVWVNNAGRGISRTVMDLTDADIDDMVTVNLKAPLYGMQIACAHFKARGQGHLINVSTMLARAPFAPIRSAYSAVKAGLNMLTANLRMELRGTGITVSLVSPGIVQTDFGLNALHGGADNRTLPFSQPVQECAEAIADVIETPRADAYTQPGAQQRIVAYFAAEDMAAYEAQVMTRR
jgi:NAD(P)-dependent dehydrogenase (short-subunit alcohol dehydrogenase family)